MAMTGLCCCMWAVPRCSKWGPPHSLGALAPTAVVSPMWSAGSRAQGLSSCSVRAQQSQHTGLLAPRHVTSPRPGIEPASPALAGGLSTIELPGKPSKVFHQEPDS